MKIEIEDGKPVVKFKASERTALSEAKRVCGELSKWLNDENATDAQETLAMIVKDYIPGEAAEPSQQSEAATEAV